MLSLLPNTTNSRGMLYKKLSLPLGALNMMRSTYMGNGMYKSIASPDIVADEPPPTVYE